MTIFNIVGDIRALSSLVESLTDEETGETREPTEEEKLAFAQWITEQSEAFDEKFDRVCKVYRNLRATADVCIAERDALNDECARLSKRAKAREAEANRVKGLIWYALDALGKQKHKTELFSAGIQNTASSVRVGDSLHSEEEIIRGFPDDFVTRDISTAAIVKGIKDGMLYLKPVSTNQEDIENGSAVSPLDDGSVFWKPKDGAEEKLVGIKYLPGKTCVIR